MSNPTPWTEELEQRLRELWAEGLSTPEIGRRLGKSKNGVVGKAHRLDLPARPSPIIRSGEPRPVRPRQVRAAATLAVLRSLGSAAPKPAPVAVAAPAPARPVVAAPQRAPTARTTVPYSPFATCQWPTNNGRPWRFCDSPTKAGSSWCPEHHAVCFTRRVPYGYGNPERGIEGTA
ncbi:MAG: GcrA family cell cycle regulator [Acetobacteraceae bacterium]